MVALFASKCQGVGAGGDVLDAFWDSLGRQHKAATFLPIRNSDFTPLIGIFETTRTQFEVRK